MRIYIWIFVASLINISFICEGVDVDSGDTITLSASASDEDCHFEEGKCPHKNDDKSITVTWSAVFQGTSNPAGTFPSGSTGTSVQWTAPIVCEDKNVTITATANDDGTMGNDDPVPDDTTVTVKVDDTTEGGGWRQVVPSFNCAPNCTTPQETDPDDHRDACGNYVQVTCKQTQHYGGACAYEYWYNGTTLIGLCIYQCGVNDFQYKLNGSGNLIAATRHRTHDNWPQQGCDQGTPNQYDWQVYYNFILQNITVGLCGEGSAPDWVGGGTCEDEWW